MTYLSLSLSFLCWTFRRLCSIYETDAFQNGCIVPVDVDLKSIYIEHESRFNGSVQPSRDADNDGVADSRQGARDAASSTFPHRQDAKLSPSRSIYDCSSRTKTA